MKGIPYFRKTADLFFLFFFFLLKVIPYFGNIADLFQNSKIQYTENFIIFFFNQHNASP